MINLELVGLFCGVQFIMQQMFTRKIMIDLLVDTEELFRIWIGGTLLFYYCMKFTFYSVPAVLKDSQ